MARCESCGMLMLKPSQHGGGKPFNRYCINCTDDEGNLRPREEVREGWIQFSMKSEGLVREHAEKLVDEQMANMPAWK